jgi:hypothetical protein
LGPQNDEVSGDKQALSNATSTLHGHTMIAFAEAKKGSGIYEKYHEVSVADHHAWRNGCLGAKTASV